MPNKGLEDEIEALLSTPVAKNAPAQLSGTNKNEALRNVYALSEALEPIRVSASVLKTRISTF